MQFNVWPAMAFLNEIVCMTGLSYSVTMRYIPKLGTSITLTRDYKGKHYSKQISFNPISENENEMAYVNNVLILDIKRAYADLEKIK